MSARNVDTDDLSGEDEMTENPLLHLRSRQARASKQRSHSLEKKVNRSSVTDVKQLLFDGVDLPRTPDLEDHDLGTTSDFHDQQQVTSNNQIPVPLIEEDFINILAIRKDFKTNSTKVQSLPPQQPAKVQPIPKKEKQQLQPVKNIPKGSKLGSKMKKVAAVEEKKGQRSIPAKTVLGANWRNYPKPWLYGMSKKPPVVKSTEKATAGIGRRQPISMLPLPPLPEFDLDLQVASQQRLTLGLSHKSSTQAMIQSYEERKPLDELTFDEAVTSIANTKPPVISPQKLLNPAALNSFENSNFTFSQPVINDMLEQQLDVNPYANSFYPPTLDSSVPGTGEATPKKQLFDAENARFVLDRNANTAAASQYEHSESGYAAGPVDKTFLNTNGFQVATDQMGRTYVQADPRRRESQNFPQRNGTLNGQGQMSYNPYPDGRQAYGTPASQNPEYADFTNSPQMMQPVLRPLVGNYVWDGRFHQSALPLYQLNYFPEIHDQFPPPLLPFIPPPRVATPRGAMQPPPLSRNSEVNNATYGGNPAFAVPYGVPHPAMFSAHQAPTAANVNPFPIDSKPIIVDANGNRYYVRSQSGAHESQRQFQGPPLAPLHPMRQFHGGLSGYPSAAHLSFPVPTAPPPTQQRHRPPDVIFEPSVTDVGSPNSNSSGFNGNVYNNNPNQWQVPGGTMWYPPAMTQKDYYKQAYMQKLAIAAHIAAEEQAQKSLRYESPSKPPKPQGQSMRGRARLRRPKDPYKLYKNSLTRAPKGVPAKSKVDCGEVAYRLAPPTASVSLPNCVSENFIGVQDELKILTNLRHDLQTARSRSADSSCASIRVFISSRNLRPSNVPKKKVSGRTLANIKHYGHKLCPCYECRRAHGLFANSSHSMSSIEQIDYVRKNIEDLKKYKSPAVKQGNTVVFVDTPKGDKVPPLITFTGRKGYGKIPGYLIKRKDEIERERRIRHVEERKKARIDAEREKQEAKHREFQRMERRRAAAKANFCLFKAHHLNLDIPKWNPLERNVDSNYNCFLYVNGKMQSELLRTPHERIFKEEPIGPEQHPHIFNLDQLPEDLKPQKKTEPEDQPPAAIASISPEPSTTEALHALDSVPESKISHQSESTLAPMLLNSDKIQVVSLNDNEIKH